MQEDGNKLSTVMNKSTEFKWGQSCKVELRFQFFVHIFPRALSDKKKVYFI